MVTVASKTAPRCLSSLSLQVPKGQALSVEGVVTGQREVAGVAGTTGVLSCGTEASRNTVIAKLDDKI